MDERTEANRAMWDEWTDIHVSSAFYDVAAFKTSRISLHDLERSELGDVRDCSLLHLQCHFGLDTMSWSTLGATVTGVDFSPNAIEAATTLASELDIDATFICADVLTLPSTFDGEFDIVYTSYGVLTWLADLNQWARVVARFLRPGGTFYMVEEHPVAAMFGETIYPPAAVEPYFRPGARELSSTSSYVDRDVPVAADRQFQWHHTLADIVTALATAGLKIEFLHEFPFCMFKRHQSMTKGSDGWWHLPDDSTPQLFSIKATAG